MPPKDRISLIESKLRALDKKGKKSRKVVKPKQKTNSKQKSEPKKKIITSNQEPEKPNINTLYLISSWSGISKSNRRFMAFLRDDLRLYWINKAKIERAADNTIFFRADGGKSVKLVLNKKKKRVYVEVVIGAGEDVIKYDYYAEKAGKDINFYAEIVGVDKIQVSPLMIEKLILCKMVNMDIGGIDDMAQAALKDGNHGFRNHLCMTYVKPYGYKENTIWGTIIIGDRIFSFNGGRIEDYFIEGEINDELIELFGNNDIQLNHEYELEILKYDDFGRIDLIQIKLPSNFPRGERYYISRDGKRFHVHSTKFNNDYYVSYSKPKFKPLFFWDDPLKDNELLIDYLNKDFKSGGDWIKNNINNINVRHISGNKKLILSDRENTLKFEKVGDSEILMYFNNYEESKLRYSDYDPNTPVFRWMNIDNPKVFCVPGFSPYQCEPGDIMGDGKLWKYVDIDEHNLKALWVHLKKDTALIDDFFKHINGIKKRNLLFSEYPTNLRDDLLPIVLKITDVLVKYFSDIGLQPRECDFTGNGFHILCVRDENILNKLIGRQKIFTWEYASLTDKSNILKFLVDCAGFPETKVKDVKILKDKEGDVINVFAGEHSCYFKLYDDRVMLKTHEGVDYYLHIIKRKDYIEVHDIGFIDKVNKNVEQMMRLSGSTNLKPHFQVGCRTYPKSPYNELKLKFIYSNPSFFGFINNKLRSLIRDANLAVQQSNIYSFYIEDYRSEAARDINKLNILFDLKKFQECRDDLINHIRKDLKVYWDPEKIKIEMLNDDVMVRSGENFIRFHPFRDSLSVEMCLVIKGKRKIDKINYGYILKESKVYDLEDYVREKFKEIEPGEIWTKFMKNKLLEIQGKVYEELKIKSNGNLIKQNQKTPEPEIIRNNPQPEIDYKIYHAEALKKINELNVLFRWNFADGEDSDKLISYLNRKLNLNWVVREVEIKKQNYPMMISIKHGDETIRLYPAHNERFIRIIANLNGQKEINLEWENITGFVEGRIVVYDLDEWIQDKLKRKK